MMPVHGVTAAGVVINEKCEILLVNTYKSGWEFPGGKIEVGESIIDGVKREIMEETGIDVEVGELFCVSSSTGIYASPSGDVPTKVIFDFICRAKGGEPRPSDENSESRYFPRDEVLGLLGTQAYVERFKAYLEYAGRPIFLSYVSKPEFRLQQKRTI